MRPTIRAEVSSGGAAAKRREATISPATSLRAGRRDTATYRHHNETQYEAAGGAIEAACLSSQIKRQWR